MRDETFQELLEAVQAAVDHYEGRRPDSDFRITVLPAPPSPMEAAEVRTLRERIGVSQSVFALTLNVSIKTVQAWESGARVADGGNLRLLRLTERHPEVVFEWMHAREREKGKPAKKPRRARKPAPQPA